jgi:hypothetical protein
MASERVCFADWQETHRDFFALVQKDRFNPECGWILAAGPANGKTEHLISVTDAEMYGVPCEELAVLEALEPGERRVFSISQKQWKKL